jgi:hypothetical protein
MIVACHRLLRAGGRACSPGTASRSIPRYRHQYGLDVAEGHTLHHRAQVMLSLVDAWIFEPALLQRVRWVPWYPGRLRADAGARPLGTYPRVRAHHHVPLRRTHDRSGGARLDLHPARVRPGRVSSDGQGRMPPPARLAAGHVHRGDGGGEQGHPESRKAFPQQFEAFSLFAAKHPDVRLYVHSNSGAEGSRAITTSSRWRRRSASPTGPCSRTRTNTSWATRTNTSPRSTTPLTCCSTSRWGKGSASPSLRRRRAVRP